VAVGQAIAQPGTVLWLIIDILNTSGSTSWNHVWNYDGISNVGAPTDQGWNRRSSNDVVRISYNDTSAADQSTDLGLVIPGSDLRFEQVGDASKFFVYSVNTVTDNQTFPEHFSYGVSLVATGNSGPDVAADCTVTATIPIPAGTAYSWDEDYWIDNSTPDWADVRGHLELNGVEQSGDADDMFGINVTFQDASLPADWQLVALSDIGAGGTSSASSRQLTRNETAWVSASAELFELYLFETVDGLDMEVARRTIPDPSGHTARYMVQGKRTDGMGYFLGEYSALIWNDGGADVNLVVKVEEMTQPTLRFQIETDGDEIIYELRGFAGQTWRWKLLEFYGDIT
jgi:hypothetical protein